MGKTQKVSVSKEQAIWLTRCIGASTFIYNAKTAENEYYYSFAKKFIPITKWGCKNAEYEWIDSAYSRYIQGEETKWIKQVPATVLRNTASIWNETMWDCLKGKNGSPNFKNRSSNRYASFTNDTFKFDLIGNNYKLFLGQKKNNIGYLPVVFKKSFFKKDNNGNILFPKTIWIKPTKHRNQFHLSFNYEDGLKVQTPDELRVNIFKDFRNKSEEELKTLLEGMDRGVTIPAHTTQKGYVWKESSEKNVLHKELKRKKWQIKLARQKKGSNRRKKTVNRIAKTYEKQTNIRKNENHHISKSITEQMVKDNKKALIAENLLIDNMTTSAKGTIEKPGTNVAQKSGLNKAILNRALGQLIIFLEYKLRRHNIALYKVSAVNTSIECAICGHTHKDNRSSQEEFRCTKCGHCDNADHNASVVLVKRAIKLILDSGSELGNGGLLKSSSPQGGRGRKTSKSLGQRDTTRQKRKVRSSNLEALPFGIE